MDFKVNSILKTYGVGNPQSTAYKQKTEGIKQSSSALEVSNSVVQFNNTLDVVKNTTDVREDVVAEYKGLLDSGEYEVSTDLLADKLLGL